jgi:hypothetical protein
MVRQGVFRTEDRNAAVRAPDAQRLRRRHARQSASNQQEINETRVHGEDYLHLSGDLVGFEPAQLMY